MSRGIDLWHQTPDIPASHFVDNRIYTDETIAREEQEKIFGRTWKLCCHESELPDAGDFRTCSVAGKPLVIIRDGDGEIRTFFNVCPHRGATLVRRPSGNIASFTCLYHRWTFDRTGACLGITYPTGYDDCGLDKDDFSLRPVRTEVRLGLVFVNLGDGAESLDEFLGDALESVAGVLGTRDLEVFHYHSAILNVNWKLWYENNAELYHILLHVINRTTNLKSEGYLRRSLKLYANGHAALEPGKLAYDKIEGWEERTQTMPGLGPDEQRLITLFPDVLINVRASCMRIDTITPIGPTRVLIEYRGLGIKGEPAEERTQRINDHNQYWGPFGRNVPEDAVAVVSQGKTMRENASRYSVYARGDNPPIMSDESLRRYYGEWGRRMGRRASDPDRAPDGAAVA